MLDLQIDLDKYCCGCDNDEYTELKQGHHLRWCSLCWDWQKTIPTALRQHIDELRAKIEQTPKMPCFCGTKNAHRCPRHVNPVR